MPTTPKKLKEENTTALKKPFFEAFVTTSLFRYATHRLFFHILNVQSLDNLQNSKSKMIKNTFHAKKLFILLLCTRVEITTKFRTPSAANFLGF